MVCSPCDRKRVRHDLATKQQHIYFTIIKKDGKGGKKKSNNVRASKDTLFYSVPRFFLPSLGCAWLVLRRDTVSGRGFVLDRVPPSLSGYPFFFPSETSSLMK